MLREQLAMALCLVRAAQSQKEFEVVNKESITLEKMCFSSSGNSVAKCIKRIYSNSLL